jgi:hypothetical protein
MHGPLGQQPPQGSFEARGYGHFEAWIPDSRGRHQHEKHARRHLLAEQVDQTIRGILRRRPAAPGAECRECGVVFVTARRLGLRDHIMEQILPALEEHRAGIELNGQASGGCERQGTGLEIRPDLLGACAAIHAIVTDQQGAAPTDDPGIGGP